LTSPAAPPPAKAEPANRDARATNPYGQLPLRFEPNRGQADPAPQFVVRGASEPLRMKVVGTKVASGGPQGQGPEPPGGVSNYFFGNDPSRWLKGVPHFARVRYTSVYEGVDVEYYGNQRRLEYDFRVAGDRYVFNLRTTGTYVLVFQAGADPLTHGVRFQVK
jgi:hypothetical protein